MRHHPLMDCTDELQRQEAIVACNEAGSFIGKLLVFEREAPYLHRTVNLVLVNEVLGF